MLSGIPAPTGSLVQRNVFYGTSETEGAAWQTYDIPPNISMLYIFLWGGGGAGGVGFAGTGRGASGGGGGGGGGQTRILMPAPLIPSTLYLSIGLGGIPTGATGTRNGVDSRISIYPDNVANHCVARASGGTNGSAGNTTGAANGGTGGAVATAGVMPLGFMGLVTVVAGPTGGIGGHNNTTPPAGFGASTAPAVATTTTTNNGGTGGGGAEREDDTSGSGGPYIIDGALFFPENRGGVGNISEDNINGGRGSNGFFVNKNLLYTYGGTGGGSGKNGGAGGPGQYGSGGGGGGACLTGDTPGIGGNGGDGLAIIYAW